MEPCAVCILGMHRSGTSAVTRSINLLGAYLGENSDFETPLIDNPSGYWERSDIVNFDGRLLDQLKITWDTIAPLPNNWHELDEIKPLKNELIEFIKDIFSNHHLWAWKDPRLSLLLPIWKCVLNEMGINFSVIFVLRNPIDVAKSLKKRDGFSFDKSFGIWFNYNISAFHNLSDLQPIFIHYDRLVDNWEAELRRCSSDLKIPWPKNDSQLKKKLDHFIRPELRHSVSGIDDLKRANPPEPVVELYSLLIETMEFSQPQREVISDIERLACEFKSYARFFQFDMARLWRSDQELYKRDLLLIKKDHQIESLFTSYSWRITKPLRLLIALYKKVVKYNKNQPI